MNATDTLQFDSARWAVWTSDSDYDYGRELVQTDQTLLGQLQDAFAEWMDSLFGGTFGNISTETWVLIAVVITGSILLYLFLKHPELFGRANKQLVEEDSNTEDTIYRDDFEGEIRRAVQAQDWHEACRLTYLYALRLLHDGRKIAWRPYKTPTQYTREFGLSDFRTLTNHFIRIRYGGFAASEELLATMRALFVKVVPQNEPIVEEQTSEEKRTPDKEKGGEA